jgi:hypothetical protein
VKLLRQFDDNWHKIDDTAGSYFQETYPYDNGCKYPYYSVINEVMLVEYLAHITPRGNQESLSRGICPRYGITEMDEHRHGLHRPFT